MSNNNDDDNETPYWKKNKTVGTPSVSGPSGPSKAAPSVEYSSNKLGNTQTVYDGNTPVTSNATPSEKPTEYWASNDPTLTSLKKAPGMGGSSGFEKEHYAPCINPSCKSYGKSHPNCRCYSGPGGTSLENGMFAHGGQVCKGMHLDSCEHFADGGTIAENMMMHHNPKNTLDHVGAQHGLLHLLTKVGHSKSEDPHKHFDDYIQSSKKGHKTVHGHLEGLFTSHHIEPDKHDRESLKAHLQDLRENPEKMLNIGGSLGDNLPAHATHLVAKSGDAVNHFNAIKPKSIQSHPLDGISHPDKHEETVYNRHLDLAQNPSIILNHVKDGTLLPSDLSTIQAIYPELHKHIKEKAFEALISAKEKGMEIPYKMKQGLSLLMGQDLDSTMTSQSMQAIIHSAGPQQQKQQSKAKPKKASGVELNQLNKVNAMDATTLQDRAMDKAKD